MTWGIISNTTRGTEPRWRFEMLQALRQQFAALGRVAWRSGATLADLPKDASGRLSYTERGVRRPNIWAGTAAG